MIAPTATVADALSTALSILPMSASEAVLNRAGAAAAWFVLPDRSLVRRRA